jgi:hypothetical protein
MEQHSAAWFDIKLGRFSASKFKGLTSTKSTASYQNTIMDVVAEILTGQAEPAYVTDDMNRGTELEPEARQHYEAMFDVKVNEVGFVESEDPIYGDYSGVSPDGLIADDGLIEIKCPKATTLFKYYGMKKCPNEYKWQVQGQLMITERKYCDFFAYYPKLKPFILRVYPDTEMHDTLQKELLIAVQTVKEKIKFYNEINSYEG